MQLNDQLNVILKGRKFKKMLEHIYVKIRTECGLRQIEVEIMFYLSQRPHDSSTDISRNLFLNKGHVSQAMNNLCVKGYVEASIDPKDRRYVTYTYTDKGNEMMKEAARIRQLINEQLLQGVTTEELEVFERVSTIISGNIDHISVD